LRSPNHRLISLEDGKVTFRWKDYAHKGKKRKMTLAAEEFIRRFLVHVLPKGLVRIRYYGWMANRRRRECAIDVARCWQRSLHPTMRRPQRIGPPDAVHNAADASRRSR
jgi:hypothetical protein